MSLDIYAKSKKKIQSGQQLGTGYRKWSREERATATDLTNEVLWINITHNLGKMASHVPIEWTDECGNKYKSSLYYVMWRPDEILPSTKIKLKDVREPLEIGFQYLLAHEKELSKYNPENGWGHYENFVHCLPEYIRACYKWPNAVLEVSR